MFNIMPKIFDYGMALPIDINHLHTYSGAILTISKK